MARTARHDEQQLRLFEDNALDSRAPDSEAQSGTSTELDARTADGSPVPNQAGTVSFVAPDGYQVPADALRRIVGLMIAQASHSSETEAS